MLELKQLRREFGGLIAVKDISFKVNPHEIKGLIGPNGAGKTTTFNLIARALNVTSGHIVFNGRDVTKLNEYEISRLGVVRTFQNVKLFSGNDFTVMDNVLIGYDKLMKSGYLSAALQLRSSRREEQKVKGLARELIDMVGLKDYMDTPVKNLAYGHQRLVEIARALISNPPLLLLDEPAAGLNDVETKLLGELLIHINKKFGTTILLIEHHMGLVMKVCESIVVMNYGEKIAEGSPSEIKTNPQVIQAYLGKELFL